MIRLLVVMVAQSVVPAEATRVVELQVVYQAEAVVGKVVVAAADTVVVVVALVRVASLGQVGVAMARETVAIGVNSGECPCYTSSLLRPTHIGVVPSRDQNSTSSMHLLLEVYHDHMACGHGT